MRVAIVGTGIAGNTAAYCLSTAPHVASVTVYEREARAGGHSATVDIDYDGRPIAVDTGFIVYNTLNYPNLVAMFDHLGVETKPSDMSFSLSSGGGNFEWAGKTGTLRRVADGLLAQRRNLVRPRYWTMLRDVLRFQKLALADRAAGHLTGRTLGDYLDWRRFSPIFRDDYIVPMGAAIWSTSPKDMLAFPADSFVAFFDNHRLLQWDRPVWRTVEGGSRRYVEKLTHIFSDRIRLSTPVARILRTAQGVLIRDESGREDLFDHVVIAAHAPDALALLSDASAEETAVLGAMRYAPNDVVLHRDERLMPKRRSAWAAWNVLRGTGDDERDERPVAVTYWMNALQSIDADRPLFITLNPPFEPAEGTVFGRYAYDHPQYDRAAIEAQGRLETIQGRNRTWFCGAWAGHGFHEDGLKAGLAVARGLGAEAPWLRTETLRRAAE